MSDRSPNEIEQKVLAESDAKRVLSRAIELEHVRTAGSTVAELRAVAGEVGVSAGSFDAALAELDESKQAPVPVKQTRTPRRVRLSVIGGALVALFAFFVFMRIPAEQASVPAVPSIEEAIMLRCLSPDEAGEMIRLALGPSVRNVQLRGRPGSRLLIVRATPEQMQKVKSLLDEKQAAGSIACTAQGTSPGTR